MGFKRGFLFVALVGVAATACVLGDGGFTTPPDAGAPGAQDGGSEGSRGANDGGPGASSGQPCVPKSDGPRSGNAGDVTDFADGGTEAEWTVPLNALAPDGLVSSANSQNSSRQLNVRQYAFEIPTTATIVGVEVAIKRSATIESPVGGSFGLAADNGVALVTADGASQARLAPGTWPTAGSVQSYGSDTDRWGLPLTPAIVNAPEFGAGISVRLANAGTDAYLAHVDSIQVTVHYCE